MQGTLELATGVTTRLWHRAPVAVLVVEGRTHTVRYANPAAARLLCAEPAELIGDDLQALVPAEVRGRFTQLLDRVRGSGEADGRVEISQGPAESRVWCSCSIWPLGDEHGADGGLVVQIRETTDEVVGQQRERELNERIREINEQLVVAVLREQEMAERAEEASRAKSEFLAVMSHELRTPLNAVIGYTDLLEGEIVGGLNEKQKEQLGRIRRSSWHLLELIEDILGFARLEVGDDAVASDRVGAAELCREAAELVEPLAADKQLPLRIEEPPEPLILLTDRRKLRQVLVNLLSNAVKYSDAGEIVLWGWESDENVCFAVEDHGIGIPPEHLERIFEPFWQVEQARTRTVGGAGLGLALTRRLVGTLGGAISVQSTRGEGSTFTVSLPRTAAA